MRYTLLLHYPEMSAEELGEEALKVGMAAFDAYAKALDEADALLSAEVLAPSTATTPISRKTGELLIQDGPFAGTKDSSAAPSSSRCPISTRRSRGPNVRRPLSTATWRSVPPPPVSSTGPGRTGHFPGV